MSSLLRRAWIAAAAPDPPGGMTGPRAGLPPGPDGLGVGGMGLSSDAVPPSRVATANSIIKFLSMTQGTLPRLIRERGDLSRRPILSPEFRYIWGAPNRDHRTGAMSFWIRAFAHLEGWNNIFLWRNRLGSRLVSVDLVHPARVAVNVDHGEKRFTLDGARKPVYTADDILHIYGLSFDGVKGISPVAAGALTHQHADLLDRYGRNFLRRLAAPAVAVMTKDKLDDEATDEFYDLYDEQFGGPERAGGVILVQGGNSIERLTVPPEEAQYLQSRQFTREEVLGFYAPGLPHHLLGWRSNTSNFGTGIEAQNRHLVQHVLRSRLNLIQDAINAELLPADLQMEFSVKDLLRGDAKTQAEVYSKMRDRGALSREEWREEAGFPPAAMPDDFTYAKNATKVDATSGEPEPEPGAAMPPPGPPVAELRCGNADCASHAGDRPGKLLGREVVQATIECPDCREVTRHPPLSARAATDVADAVMAALERRAQPARLS